MADTPDIAATNRIEMQHGEFNPEKNPILRSVIVKTEIQPGFELRQRGWMTDIPGAKVDLQVLAEQNERREHVSGSPDKFYKQIYFTTASGTIYEAANIANDMSWRIRAATTNKENTIRDAATLEVGKRFQSPHGINGQPELDTSPVRSIIILEENKKNTPVSLEMNIYAP